MTTFKRLVLLSLLVTIGLAQSPTRHNVFTVTRTKALSGAATVMTVQQPAASANNVQAQWIKIFTDVAVTVELERDGTAATATGETEVGTSPDSPTPTATAFYDSDVGNGTTVDTFDLPADTMLVADLLRYEIYLMGNGTGINFSLRSSSVTGNVRITICWSEWTP